VTNYHVIAGATDVQVKLTNGWLFSALGVVGFREEWDLALIKIAGPPLPFVELGNSDNLQPGQRVVLIGNPHGLANTVADGLVSSLREIERGIKVIQTTTPASEGNSGSPLFNMQGEVVGIISFKIIEGENLNFALPANLVREIALRDQPIPFVSLAPSPPSTPQPPPRPPVASRPPEMEEVYKNALNAYAKGNYDLAITGFRAYIQNYPKTSLVANAQYWLGESYYSQRNYAQAVEEFDVVIRDYPDSPKVPSALFKQGDAYVQINDTKRATTVLCELMTKYPETREARLARERNVRCR
jgi:tol-pal system protein YbgF